MSSHTGLKTVDEVADTPVYLALIPSDAAGPKGAFIAEGEEVPFKAHDYEYPFQWSRN